MGSGTLKDDRKFLTLAYFVNILLMTVTVVVVISNYNTFLNRLPLIFFSLTVENLGECCTIVTENSTV